MNRWVAGARPRTLPAAVVPVLVGTAAATGADGGTVVWWRAVAALVVAVAIQVGTNYVNDYADAERGADTAERLGPTRLVASGLATAGELKRAALAAAVTAAVAGLALAVAVGPELVVVGAVSLAAGFFYTAGPRPYGYAGLGEVFVFVFFGVVATVGSAYVHLERIDLLALAASVPVGLLATALLVVNNLRDIPTDTASGKRTLAVRLGAPPTRALYVALLAGAFVALPVLALSRPGALLAALSAPLALRPLRVVASEAVGVRLLPALAQTGRLQLGYGVLLALGLAVSA
ncbi:MAG: 1,4-dihydroxy-2-naphthoate polyprenyltransferase [Actinobacteria bacterium]|nr:1,4-dihydroxy-2-naphthoate polyprenyltransferase [Actinomycetota bacterium]MBW3641869.1 1,4-dihydroxy-2-naphthoate polyprenyltransferase [Actinomycetota bacterium]